MTFNVRLEVPAVLPAEAHVDVAYDAELDDVRSILRDLCSSLAEVPHVNFTMTIGDVLPVTVRRDLVIVMEQLADTLVELSEQGAATLDLYEQGIELQLVFTVEGDQTRIEGRDLMGRPSLLREERLPREAVEESLRLLARTFVDAAKRRSPERASHPWFVNWSQSLRTASQR